MHTGPASNQKGGHVVSTVRETGGDTEASDALNTGRSAPPLTPRRRPEQLADNTPVVIGFGAPPEAIPADREALVRQYSPLIEKILSRLPGPAIRGRLDRDDLRQEALLALLTAADLHQPARGPFLPFARTVISNALASALRAADPLPSSARRDIRLINAAQDRQGHLGGWKQLSADTGLSNKRISMVLRWAAVGQQVELDSSSSLPDADRNTPEALALQACESDLLRTALMSLPDRDRGILWARVVDGATVRDVAAREGISPARVCQLQTRALTALRALLR
jgi:RNA polymerase sigma factor (sigma-70 family)